MTDIPTASGAVSELLVAANVGQISTPTADWFITVGQTIDQPSNLIVIKRTGGLQSNPAWAIDYPSIQVTVRGAANNYRNAEQTMLKVKNALLGVPSQTINGDRLTAINAIGDYLSMGNDINNRPSFVMNFALIYEPTNAGYRQ